MDQNIKDMLGGILSSLPADKKEEVQNCGSKDEFLGVLGAVKGLDIGGILGSLTGGNADSNPIGGLLKGLGLGGQSDGGSNLLGQVGDMLKGIDWADIQKFITSFFNKK